MTCLLLVFHISMLGLWITQVWVGRGGVAGVAQLSTPSTPPQHHSYLLTRSNSTAIFQPIASPQLSTPQLPSTLQLSQPSARRLHAAVSQWEAASFCRISSAYTGGYFCSTSSTRASEEGKFVTLDSKPYISNQVDIPGEDEEDAG